MSARHNQVGLITRSNEVLLWNIGGSLTSVERPEIPKSGNDAYCSPEAIIFHPVNHGHFFIFYHVWPPTGMLAQEFVEGKYHKTQ
jgi:hypothetical protein